MDVLVDSSVWVSFFRGRKGEEKIASALDYLLSGDEAVIDEIVKTEVMPMMVAHHEDATLMDAVRTIPLQIDWKAVRDLQVNCLRKGINKVGVCDLILALNAVQAGVPLFSLDRHFELIKNVLPDLQLWPCR